MPIERDRDVHAPVGRHLQDRPARVDDTTVDGDRGRAQPVAVDDVDPVAAPRQIEVPRLAGHDGGLLPLLRLGEDHDPELGHVLDRPAQALAAEAGVLDAAVGHVVDPVGRARR